MKHEFFFDGNQKKSSWVIKTEKNTIEQLRDHADIYLDKITKEQSRYIALHVGIFWRIGRFIIKNHDEVKINLDSESMFENLVGKKENHDEFIQSRSGFITQLIEQRGLNIKYQIINKENNLAHRLVEC